MSGDDPITGLAPLPIPQTQREVHLERRALLRRLAALLAQPMKLDINRADRNAMCDAINYILERNV